MLAAFGPAAVEHEEGAAPMDLDLDDLSELMGVAMDAPAGPAGLPPPPSPSPSQSQSPHPETFTVGRCGATRRTADHMLEIEAIKAVLEPAAIGHVLLSTDALTGTAGVMDSVNAWRAARGLPGRFAVGTINGLLASPIFGFTSRQMNFCPRADCRRVCTRTNCAGHYDAVVRTRTRFTVIEGVSFR